eukprot:gnl/Hemi2/4260_TR1486_c0_g1_i1.p1 gnl/Hemi2/4260_TR1486_c0_g1~~gnl/Hemi2/4260_TR1486_c0_g1_i1.p1  ORF type:complete len:222 (-),score=49.96 gnl/Hemi2/4260_TR1486_c0_g1_i1:228-893(-)
MNDAEREHQEEIGKLKDDLEDARSCCSYFQHSHLLLRIFFYRDHDVMARWKRFLIFLLVLAGSAVSSFLLVTVVPISGFTINWQAVLIVLGAALLLIIFETIVTGLFEWTETKGTCFDVCCWPCRLIVYIIAIGGTGAAAYFLYQKVNDNPSYALSVWGVSYAISLFLFAPARLLFQWMCCMSVKDAEEDLERAQGGKYQARAHEMEMGEVGYVSRGRRNH